MDAIKLHVSPEKLYSTSAEFSMKASEVQNLNQQMMTTINSLSSSWTGDAAVLYNTHFKGLEDDMNKIYRMIMEHSNDLSEITKNYLTAETQNTETASGLRSDVM